MLPCRPPGGLEPQTAWESCPIVHTYVLPSHHTFPSGGRMRRDRSALGRYHCSSLVQARQLADPTYDWPEVWLRLGEAETDRRPGVAGSGPLEYHRPDAACLEREICLIPRSIYIEIVIYLNTQLIPFLRQCASMIS